jgi:hypothetical protein
MNKSIVMNKIYLGVVLTFLLVGNQGLCAGAAAGGEAGSHGSLHNTTSITQGRISSFLDPKSQAAFSITSKAGRQDVELGKQPQLLDAFKKAIRCQEAFCLVDRNEIEGIANHPQWLTISQDVSKIFKRALDEVIGADKIIALRGSEFPLTCGD